MVTPIWWLTKAAQSFRASSLSTLFLSNMLPASILYSYHEPRCRSGRMTAVIDKTPRRWTASEADRRYDPFHLHLISRATLTQVLIAHRSVRYLRIERPTSPAVSCT